MLHARSLLLAAMLASMCATVLECRPAFGAVPDPRNSVTDYLLVGNSTGTPMGGATPGYDVIVRDINNAPIPGSIVVLDFSTSGIRLYSTQNSGTTLNCALHTLKKACDSVGRVKFAPRIGRYNNGNSILVTADTVILASVKGRSTDIDGLGGRTGLGDLALFSSNLINNAGAQETDFDLDGTTALGDLALFSSELLSPGADTYCP